MDARVAADEREIPDLNVAGQEHTIREDRPAAELDVVAEVAVGHEVAPLADDGAGPLLGTAMDRHVLSDHTTRSDPHEALDVLEGQVLGHVADHRARVDAALRTDGSVAEDHRIRSDLDILADHCAVLDQCGWVDPCYGLSLCGRSFVYVKRTPTTSCAGAATVRAGGR